ncbi:MAG TPA: 1-(5-phosphoribosyl)-5-[(5-phosphoribosylamino)methylideneamino]imidazole-4-carboxamide isomerase [Caulobacteraceae bacterium]|jgi:phosphoribosylformimino-5-aminoimidazole carboxamide ribotide isomerase
MLIYPAVDLRAGVCVRLLQGRFDAVTRYDEDPRARLDAFAAAGAEWVHVVDLDGAEAGGPRQHELIGELARVSGLRVQAGGGVRMREDVARLLQAGVERVVVGSTAVRDPQSVARWLEELGADAITVALDVRLGEAGPEAVTHGWREGSGVSLWEALERLGDGRLRHLLVTDVAKDGALAGPNVDLVAEIVRRRPDLKLQASGGVRGLEDLAALRTVGASGAVVGKALYEGLFRLEEALGAG